MAAPAALAQLVDRWRQQGQPQQPGIPWSRTDWLAAFPEHADHLRSLPDPLDRAAVRATCHAAADSPEDAVRAFTTVMTWGFGNVGYGRWRTRAILTNTPHAGERLATVARTLRDDGVLAAYGLFSRPEECRLAGLGPAFGTKFLYFVQPPEHRPRAVVLDALVGRWWEAALGERLNVIPWSPRTYGRYVSLMEEWSGELECAPDDLELCIFQEMANRSGGQWAAGSAVPAGVREFLQRQMELDPDVTVAEVLAELDRSRR